MKKCVFNLLVILLTSSCATLSTSKTSYLPETFTTENLMKTHMGMSSKEIQKMYGDPKNISQSVCGSAKVGGTWRCTTWEYGNSPYDNASFTFREKNNVLLVNSFDIERVESELPKSFSTSNVMKVKQGMSHDEIYKIFGPPRNVSQSVCGGATPHPWVCTTWEYGNSPYANAKFTFSTGENSMVLNDFNVERD